MQGLAEQVLCLAQLFLCVPRDGELHFVPFRGKGLDFGDEPSQLWRRRRALDRSRDE